MLLTLQRVKELFSYNPDTGILTRKFNTRSQVWARYVKVDGAAYPTANVVWLYHYGEWPSTILDHIDRDHYNIEIKNLRLATQQQNCYNQRRYNPTGLKGIYNCGRSKPWQAQIRINGRKVNLGRFATQEEAAEAYRQAALEHHGEFACLK